jgi:hypothetical protein
MIWADAAIAGFERRGHFALCRRVIDKDIGTIRPKFAKTLFIVPFLEQWPPSGLAQGQKRCF